MNYKVLCCWLSPWATFLALLLMMHLVGTQLVLAGAERSFNYTDALAKSLLFFEAQRSGRLPAQQRVTWRGDSALLDGQDHNVDLVGGYYDAGDNVKFGYPMAFTVTVLAWGALENAATLEAVGELGYAHDAIRWGTDYLLKASAAPSRLWVQVGNAQADHQCWERPESMKTPRTSTQINASRPGTEVAAETAAALAAASLVFQKIDAEYSTLLLQRAIRVFHFADQYRASYTGECPFYCSYSGYEDDLLWAAAWLLRASKRSAYLFYIRNALQNLSLTSEFDWDNKNAGVAVLLAQRYFKGDETMKTFKQGAEFFMCANLPGNSLTQVGRTPGGMLYVRAGANTQYVGGAAFLAAVYSGYLSRAERTHAGNQSSGITCGSTNYSSKEVLSFAKGQVDYILGKNPLGMSYMVGFGEVSPTQLHHRGASIPSSYVLSETSDPSTDCAEGFTLWYERDAPNPNMAVGAIVGGPDQNDSFIDLRSNSVQLEPTTYINAFFVGALGRLSHVQ